jgi:hypothetical protein
MQPSAEDIEATKRKSQQVLERSEALLAELGRSNVDFAKLYADLQAEVKRMSEVVNSPKATEKIAEQYLAAIEELRAELESVDSILSKAPAPVSTPANEGSAAKPSRRRGMRV